MLPQCSTHCTIAADVEKFPFRHLCIKRTLVALQSVPMTMMLPPLPTTLPPATSTTSQCTYPIINTATTTTKSTPVNLEAINCRLICSIQLLQWMQEQLQSSTTMMMMMTMPPPAPKPTQDTMTTVCSNLPPQITTVPTIASTSNWLLRPTTMTMIPIAKPPSQLPLQQDSSLTPSSSKLKEQLQPEPINITLPSTCKNMELDQLLPTTLQPTAPPHDAAPFATKPSKRHLPTVPTMPLMPIHSWLQRLLDNIHDITIDLWMPDAVYWHSVQNWPNTQDLPLAQSTNSTLYLLENPLNHTTKSLLADSATSPYNLAFDIHPKLPDCCQKCNQHHSPLTNSANKSYNLALDLHPMLTNHHWTCHQQHIPLSLAPPVQGLAQNKQPL